MSLRLPSDTDDDSTPSPTLFSTTNITSQSKTTATPSFDHHFDTPSGVNSQIDNLHSPERTVLAENSDPANGYNALGTTHSVGMQAAMSPMLVNSVNESEALGNSEDVMFDHGSLTNIVKSQPSDPSNRSSAPQKSETGVLRQSQSAVEVLQRSTSIESQTGVSNGARDAKALAVVADSVVTLPGESPSPQNQSTNGIKRSRTIATDLNQGGGDGNDDDMYQDFLASRQQEFSVVVKAIMEDDIEIVRFKLASENQKTHFHKKYLLTMQDEEVCSKALLRSHTPILSVAMPHISDSFLLTRAP
jgi:hypothetical protein